MDLDIPENGTLQLYTANKNVWFDDFKVTFTPQLIVQESSYYPKWRKHPLVIQDSNKKQKPCSLI